MQKFRLSCFSDNVMDPFESTSKTQQKVLIIGLDGATLDLIAPWGEQGELPALQKLIQHGVSGRLQSTYPPLTGPAWSSFITGKSPGRHSIFEFFRRQPGSYRQTLNSRYDIRGASIWSWLSQKKLHVGVMGVPLTYPPEEVNGFLISGLLTPAGCRDFTYPREILTELEAQLGKYLYRHDEKYRPANPHAFIREQYEILENNTHAAEYLLKQKPWDFFMVHFLGTDVFQHEFWHVLDPSHPQHNPEERERLGNVILDFYRAVDQAVARVLEAAGDALVVVMSDHGFGPVYKYLNLNTWLLQEGYLRLKGSLATKLRYLLFRMGFNYAHLARLVLASGFGKQAKQMGRARREDLQRKLFLSLDDIDWSKSRVYSMGNFGQLYVNLKGREPQGIVEPGEKYESLLEELARRLHSLVDPENGRPVIEEVFRPEEVYQGPFTAQAPDLMYFTQRMEYKAMGLSDFSSPRVFDPVYGTTGHHRMDGILLCYGPGVFKEGETTEDARIHDLAPTILYALGQAIPGEMDGKVLLDLFTPSFRAAHKVDYVDLEESLPDERRKALTQQEESDLIERLRDLGYVT